MCKTVTGAGISMFIIIIIIIIMGSRRGAEEPLHLKSVEFVPFCVEASSNLIGGIALGP
jgi:hypothetical protein